MQKNMRLLKKGSFFNKIKLYYNNPKSRAINNLKLITMATIDLKTKSGQLISSIYVPDADKFRAMNVYGQEYIIGLEETHGDIIVEERTEPFVRNRMNRRVV